MTQQEINDAEWRNPDNWSDKVIGVYFSKRDSRIWVAKQQPWLGWTLNLAHPAGAWTMILAFISILLFVITVNILAHVLT